MTEFIKLNLKLLDKRQNIVNIHGYCNGLEPRREVMLILFFQMAKKTSKKWRILVKRQFQLIKCLLEKSIRGLLNDFSVFEHIK